MKKLVHAIVAVAALLATAPASAANIVYAASGNASGTLNGIGFSGPVTIASVGDLATRQPCMNNGVIVAGCQFVLNDSVLISNDSFGVVELAWQSISFFNDGANVFGFSLIGLFPHLPVYSFAFVNVGNATAEFAAWDGIADFGPIATNWGINGPQGTYIPTSGGELRFTTQRPVAATFAALNVAGAIPEPATWLTLIAGFGLLGAALRRRPARSAAFAG